MGSPGCPLDPLGPPGPLNRPPQTHEQVSLPHCTLKITSTALQITFTPVTHLTHLTVVIVVVVIVAVANNHPEDGGFGHLHMIILRIWPLAKDHPEDPASFK